MDFLKHCSTNVAAIDGFSHIHYRVYSIISKEQVDSAQQLRDPLHSNLYLLHKAASDTRMAGGYAAVVIGQKRLWVFGVSEAQISKLQTSIEVQSNAEDLLKYENIQSLKCILSGSITAAGLLARAAPSPDPTLGGPVNSGNSRKRSTDMASMTAQAIQTSANVSDNGTAASDIYKVLVEALVLTLSHGMAREHFLLPLNFRTFVITMPDHADIRRMQNSSQYPGSPNLLVDIEVELTAGGTILVSTKRTPQSSLRQIISPGFDIVGSGTNKFSPFIRVAPSGRIFQIARRTSDEQQGTDDRSGPQITTAKTDETGFLRGSPWREQVKDWLAGIGMPLLDSEGDYLWVLITTPRTTSDALENSNTKNTRSGSLTMEWPAMLCFEFSPNNSSKLRSSIIAQDSSVMFTKEPGIDFFQSVEQKGFLDPLDFAFSFLMNHESREKEIEFSRSETITHVAFGSPSHITPANGHENFGATAIYPTPPDGLPSGVTPGSLVLETAVAAAAIANSQTSVRGDQEQVEELMTNPTRTDEDLGDADILPDEDAAESQFEDGDDDLFESNGITEADLNFFDEPEMDIETPEVAHATVPMSKTTQDEQVDEISMSTGTEPTGLDQNPDDGLGVNILVSPALEQGVTQEQTVNTKSGKVEPNESSISSVSQLLLTPPLNPQTIQDDLNMQYLSMVSPVTTELDLKRVTEKAWDRVKFNSDVRASDQKYASEGRFSFNPGIRIIYPDQSNRFVPKDASSNNLKSPSNPRLYNNVHRLKFLGALSALTKSHAQIRKQSPANDDEEDTDSSSSVDDASTYNFAMVRSSKRRKYLPATPSETKRDSEASVHYSSHDIPIKTMETEKKASLSTCRVEIILAHLFLPNSSDCSLTAFPAPKERLRDNAMSPAPASADFIEIAQIVTTQAATSSAQLFPSPPDQFRSADLFITIAQDQYIIDTLKRLFTGELEVTQQTVLTNVEIQEDSPESAQVHLRHQSKPASQRLKINNISSSDGSSSNSQHIFPVPAPRLCVQKTDALWELLPTAYSFWETLGLGPVNGHKAVRAYCVYPQSDGIKVSVRRFLDNMESAWDSCRLGDHKAGLNVDGADEGLVPVTVQGSVTQQTAMLAIRKTCENLGIHLAKATSEAIQYDMIYLVNPFSNEIAVRGLCACFYALNKAFDRHAVTTPPIRNRPIFQIVPMKFIASFENPILLDSLALTTFAREVYDRCPALTTAYESDLPITTAASAVLAEPLPRGFHFKLTTDPPSDLLHERAYMNVAYCISSDERWITAAWTDSAGKYQHTACYSNGNGITLDSIAQEIWESTLHYTKPRKVIWQIFIAKVGSLELSERTMWQRLASATPQTKFPVSLVVISVNPWPVLSIYPNAEAQPQSPFATGLSHGFPATPIATPQAQPFSPGPTPPAATALAASIAGPDAPGWTDADPSARLVDVTDESWGIILARRRSISRSLVEYNRALASGYLVKRTGPGDLDVPVVMEVDVMEYVEPPDLELGVEQRKPETGAVRRRHAESLLKEVLVMYRGLGLLARLRGMEGAESCIPWHVSAALKAETALRYCM